MEKNYQAVLFDLDYTLVDATMGIVMCTSHALEQLNLLSDEKKIISSIGMSFAEAFTYLSNSSCPEQTNHFKNHFLQKARECLTDNTVFYADAFFVLKYLKACNLKLGIVTSKFRAEVLELLKKHKIFHLFDVIICGDDVDHTKPHPESLLNALHILKFNSNQVLYVGDNVIDSKAAEAANVDFVGITTGVFDYTALSKTYHNYIVNSLLELITIDLCNLEVSNVSIYSILIFDLQKLVDTHIQQVGGYWPAEFGLARVFEELGEVYTCINYGKGHLVEELADLFIITTCLANQYCSKLRLAPEEKLPSTIPDSLSDFVIIAGELSRTISFYEGLKTPKKTDNINGVELLISKLHHLILNICDLIKVDLVEAVIRKILKANARDLKRFVKSYDPCNAVSASKLKIIQDKIPCVYAKKSKIWGAIDWDSNLSTSANSKNIYPTLKRFSKICRYESLDVFAIAAPDVHGLNTKDLSHFLKDLLISLAAEDDNNTCMSEDINSPDWQFTLNGTRLFITVFASCYPITNSRYNYDVKSTLVLFQPEISFTSNDMPRGMNDQTREKIRTNFKKNGQDYTNNIIKSNIEAARYIKPIHLEDELIAWWI